MCLVFQNIVNISLNRAAINIRRAHRVLLKYEPQMAACFLRTRCKAHYNLITFRKNHYLLVRSRWLPSAIPSRASSRRQSWHNLLVALLINIFGSAPLMGSARTASHSQTKTMQRLFDAVISASTLTRPHWNCDYLRVAMISCSCIKVSLKILYKWQRRWWGRP